MGASVDLGGGVAFVVAGIGLVAAIGFEGGEVAFETGRAVLEGGFVGFAGA